MQTTAQEIGAIIRQKRKDKNLSQKQLAVLAYNEDRYQSLLSRIENGAYKDVRFEDVTIILQGLGIDLMEIIKNTK